MGITHLIEGTDRGDGGWQGSRATSQLCVGDTVSVGGESKAREILIFSKASE